MGQPWAKAQMTLRLCGAGRLGGPQRTPHLSAPLQIASRGAGDSEPPIMVFLAWLFLARSKSPFAPCSWKMCVQKGLAPQRSRGVVAPSSASPLLSCSGQTEPCTEARGLQLRSGGGHRQHLWVLSLSHPGRAEGDSRDWTALHGSMASPALLLAKLSLGHLPRKLLVLGACPVCSPGAGRSWLLLLMTRASLKHQHGRAGKAARAGPMQELRKLIARLPGAHTVPLGALTIPHPMGPPTSYRRSSRGIVAVRGAARTGLGLFPTAGLWRWGKQPAVQ